MALVKDGKISEEMVQGSRRDSKGNNVIVYKDIYGIGSEMTYTDDGHKIKEEITLLNSPPIDEGLFTVSFAIEASDLSYLQLRNGQVRFFNGSVPVFIIEKSFVVDAIGNKVYLQPKYDGSTYTLSIPKSYFDSATYPVTIDPTVVYDIYDSAINYSKWNYTYYSNSANPPTLYQTEDTSTIVIGMYVETSVAGNSLNILTINPTELQLQRMDKVINKIYYSQEIDFSLNDFYLKCYHNEVSTTQVRMQLSLTDGTNRVVFYDDVKNCNGVDGSNNNETTVSNLHLRIYRNNTFHAYDDTAKFNQVLSTSTLDLTKNWTVLMNSTLNTLVTNNGHVTEAQFGNITYNATSWCTPSSTACLSDGQMAEYFFNTATSTTTPDNKHLAQDLTLKATSGGVPIVNGTINFNGSNYANATGVWNWINLSKQGSVEVLLSMNSVTPQYQTVMECRGGASSYFRIYANYAALTAALGSGLLLSAGHTLTPNTPTHLIINFNNGAMVIYVNGVNTINQSYTPSSENIPICLFGSSYSASNLMNGSIDYVRIYDRELLGWEVAKHYAEGESYGVTGINITILYEANATSYLKDATVRILTESTDTTYTTNTGSISINPIEGGEYTVRVYGADTGIRSYQINTTTNATYNLIVLLPLNASTALFTVRDAISNILQEGSLVTVSTIVNNTQYTVSSGYTDVVGRFEFQYSEDIKYTFSVSKSGYITKVFTLNRVESASYDVPIFPESTSGTPLNYQDVTIQFSHTPFEYQQNNSMNITFGSTLNRFQAYSIKIDYPGGSITQDGSNPSGEMLINYFNITDGNSTSKVNVSFNYLDTYGYTHNYTQSFSITGYYNVNGSISKMIHTDYGMGVLEKMIVAVLLTLILAGAAGTVMGSPGAIVGALTGYLFFVYISFVPLWGLLAILPFSMVVLIART